MIFVEGTIFNIQRFSIHDGPGIRTTVFLKGCNLHCFWCHNPESLSSSFQIQYFPQKCIGCGKCVQLCKNNAHAIPEGVHLYERNKCVNCGMCAEFCYAEALILCGKKYTPEETLNVIKKDIHFYTDGGGVTFSGGEPLLQNEFLYQTIKLCFDNKINTAVDTAGCVAWENFESILPYTDLFLFDIKHCSSDMYKKYTGADIKIITDNLKNLLAAGKDVWVRIPVIPTFNDDCNTIKGICDLIYEIQCAADNKIKKLEFMPFHKIAKGKYESLNYKYKAAEFSVPDPQLIKTFYEIANEIINK